MIEESRLGKRKSFARGTQSIIENVMFVFVAASVIEEIAGLWKLAFAVVCLVGLILVATVFRSSFRNLLGRAKIRFKRGQTEVSIDDRSAEPRLPEETLQEQKASPPREEKPGEVTGDEKTPQTDWEAKMFECFDEQNLDAAKEAYEKLQASESDPGKKLEHEAWYHWHRFRNGDEHAQRALRQLEERATGKPEILDLVRRLDANCYAFAEDYLRASQRFKDAATSSKGAIERARALKYSAAMLAKAGRVVEARNLLCEALKTITEPDAQAELYLGLADRFGAENRKEERAIMLEKALVGRPNSPGIQFDAGYAYTEAELEPLSVFHYKKTLGIDSKNLSALNNMGVAYAGLGANKLAVDYYKQAIAIGETLASANLAYILMDAGAWDEASKILAEARTAKEIHPNVNHALVKLQRIENENRERQTEIMKLASELRKFLLPYADALLSPDVAVTIEGQWESVGASGVEVKKLDKGQIEIRWLDPAADEKYRFVGRMAGRSLEGEIWKVKTNVLASLLASGAKDKEILEQFGDGRAYVTDGERIHVFGWSDDYKKSIDRTFVKARSAGTAGPTA